MLVVEICFERPGEGWHAHGFTSKTLLVLRGTELVPILLKKQRWLHVATGTTRHDRPLYDRPGAMYGFDVVVLTLAVWLVGAVGLHRADWPWDDDKPARRTVQRWTARLAPLAVEWLQTARERFIDHVAPRPLEELLPAGGIPPPEGARSRQAKKPSTAACQLRDVVWLHENVARALSIPLRSLLVVARWRWPGKPAKSQTS